MLTFKNESDLAMHGGGHGGFQGGFGDRSFENFSLLETEEIEVMILRLVEFGNKFISFLKLNSLTFHLNFSENVIACTAPADINRSCAMILKGAMVPSVNRRRREQTWAIFVKLLIVHYLTLNKHAMK